ncbi:MAG: ribosome silencing factor [Elusimicrobiota bacterium]|jgi:ribosome-associated protein
MKKPSAAADAVSKKFRVLARAAARIADEKKAEDILLLDIRGQSILADYVLLVNANSSTHARALQDSLEDELTLLGADPVHKDGKDSESWRVLDYGWMLVHILQEGTRNLFALEKLYPKAKKIAVAGEAKAAR